MQKAQEAIRQFVLRVPATQKELALAVDKVLGRTEDEDDPKSGVTPPKDNALDWAALVARLEGQSGIRADRDFLRAQIAEWEDDAAARKQYEKDYHSLVHGRNAERFSG